MLFADDTSIFSVFKDVKDAKDAIFSLQTATKLNKDLENISKWAHQRNMSFNSEPTKMSKKVLFSRKKLKVIHRNLTFTGEDVHSSQFQNYLDL